MIEKFRQMKLFSNRFAFTRSTNISKNSSKFHRNGTAFSGSTKLSISDNIRIYYKTGMTPKLRTFTSMRERKTEFRSKADFQMLTYCDQRRHKTSSGIYKAVPDLYQIFPTGSHKQMGLVFIICCYEDKRLFLNIF